MSKQNHARLSVATSDVLDVRSFEVTQGISTLFDVGVRAVSPNHDVDFDAVLGQDASFSLLTETGGRTWAGVVSEMDLVGVDTDGLATYEVRVRPRAWLMTQRTNYRVFQYKSELAIVQQLLSEWGVTQRTQCGFSHKARKFRVQYAESDFTFLCRMLEDAGISFWFDDAEGETTLVLDDDPQAAELTDAPLRFHDQPGVTNASFVTKLHVAHRVRPGKTTIGDLDHRRAGTNQPRLTQGAGLAAERALEQFDYEPGAFLFEAAASGATPTADDRGTARTDERAGATKVANRLAGRRSESREVAFESDVIALAPGSLLAVSDHPHAAAAGKLLVVRARLQGQHTDDWRVAVTAANADAPFRPAPVTPKPIVHGLESATVVGSSSDDIHTDEYGRVRVHFHWDRESQRDEASSCWIPTNQPWAGARFGGTVLPRVGQEVLVEFLGGDPDRPVVLGRTYTEHQPPPYELPRGKKLTALIGNPTPGMVMGGAEGEIDQDIFTLQRGGSPEFSNISQNVLRTQDSTAIADRMNAGRPPNIATNPNPEFAADLPTDMRTRAGYGDTRNMFVVGDAQNQNLVFMQAQRDLHILAKNNWRTVVGNYRGTAIIGNDDLHVRNKQLVAVVDAQLLKVKKDQSIDVTKKRTEHISEKCGLVVVKDATITVKTTMKLKSKKSIVFESNDAIQMRVGSSILRIDRNSIVFSSPRIDLNPAPVTAASRLEPITDDKKAAFEAAARRALGERPNVTDEQRMGLIDSSETNPDLAQAGADGLRNQFQTGETSSTISGENLAMYRYQLQQGYYTGGRTMSPEQADSAINQFIGG